MPIWIIFAAFACLALFALAFKRPKRSVTYLVLGAVVSLSYFFAVHSYLVAHRYSHLIAVDNKTVSSYQDRAPWVVAKNYASRDQGEDVGDRGNVKHVPVLPNATTIPAATAAQAKETGKGQATGKAQQDSRYTTLITGRSVIGDAGYISVRQFELPKSGPLDQAKSNSCPVPKQMGKRLGAWLPWRSLDREISLLAPFSHFDYNDAYGYCDANGKPVVVQPLYRYSGIWIVLKRFSGAAVYTPQGLQIMDPAQLEVAKIEGPTMPLNVVTTLRESLVASGSYADWWGQRAGYDTTSKDEEDTNTDNNAEFSLVTTKGKLNYVTPLSPRGSSQSIVANLVVEAQQHSRPRQGTARLETGVDLPATSSLENAIRSASVPADSEWSTRWAAGMKVYEIVPTQDGNWEASIGLGQEVNYRAVISPTGAVSVTREDPLPQGGGSVFPAEAGTSAPSHGVPTDLSALSKEQLAQLISRAAAELAARQ